MSPTLLSLQVMLADSCKKAPDLASRMEKAAMIVALHTIKEIPDNPTFFAVPSLDTANGSDAKFYTTGTTCDCVDYKQSKAPKGFCKHRLAVVFQKRLEATALAFSAAQQSTFAADDARILKASDAVLAAQQETLRVEQLALEKIGALQREIDELKAANETRKIKAFAAVQALFNAIG